MTMSSAARAKDRNAGLAGVRHLSKWKLQLSTALYKGIAKSIEDSFSLHDGLGDAYAAPHTSPTSFHPTAPVVAAPA